MVRYLDISDRAGHVSVWAPYLLLGTCFYPEDDKRERTEYFAAQAAAWLADDAAGGDRFRQGGSLSLAPPFRLRHSDSDLATLLGALADSDRPVKSILMDAEKQVPSLDLAAQVFVLQLSLRHHYGRSRGTLGTVQTYVSERWKFDRALTAQGKLGLVKKAWRQHHSVAHMWLCMWGVNKSMQSHMETASGKRFAWGTLAEKGYRVQDPAVRFDWSRRLASHAFRQDPLRDEDDAAQWLSVLWAMELGAKIAEDSRVWRPADQVWRAPVDLGAACTEYAYPDGYPDPLISKPPRELVERAIT